MSDKIKILGVSKRKDTEYYLNYKQTEEITVGCTSGKAVFDFLYLDTNDIFEVFMEIQDASSSGGIQKAIETATLYFGANCCLAMYIAEFLDYLADRTDEALSEFTNFMGSDFTAPPIDSPDYETDFVKCIVTSIEQKKAEIKSLVEDVMSDDRGSRIERFTKRSKTKKLADFNFNCYLTPETGFISFPLITMDDVIRFDLMQMLANRVEFKPCKYCGKYFVPSGRTDSEYCDRIKDGETKSCNEIGALKTFDIVHKDDPIHKAYITAYRRMDSRQRAKRITKEEFKQFGLKARAERKRCYNGELSLEEYQAILDSFI